MPQIGPDIDPQGNQASAYLTWTDAGGAPKQLFFDLVESEDWDEGATVTEHPVEVGSNITDNVRVKLNTCALKIYATNEPLQVNNWTDLQLANQVLNVPEPQFTPGDGILVVQEWDSQISLRVLAGTGAALAGGALGGGVGNAIGGLAGAALSSALFQGKVNQSAVPTNAGLVPRKPSTVQAHSIAYTDNADFVQNMISALIALKDAAQLVTVHGTKRVVDNMVIEGLRHHRGEETGTGAEIALSFKQVRIVSTITVPAPAVTVPRATKPVAKGNQNPTESAPAQSAAFNLGLSAYLGVGQ
jgi:hypothetical protein